MISYKKVDANRLDADLTAVADAIREKTGNTERLSFPDGMAAEVDAIYEAGKKAEYDAFWSNYLRPFNGTTGDHVMGRCLFAGSGWKNETFRPPFDFIAGYNISMCFYTSGITYDLVSKLKEWGINITFCPNTSSSQFAAYCNIKSLPTINLSMASVTHSSMFISNPNLHTIELLKLKKDGSVVLSNCFNECTALENITIEGTIGQNGFDIHWSTKLSYDSIVSIINALSTTTTGLTVTLSITAVNNAFETSPGAADGSTSEEWTTLIATKPNWTISLV